MAKKIINQIEKVATDYETGEIKQSLKETCYSIKNDEPRWIKMYIDSFESMDMTGIKTLVYLLPYMDYNDNIIRLDKVRREEICHKYKMTDVNLTKRIASLVKNGYIVRTCNGSFMINPKLFTNQKWSDVKISIDKFRNLTININIQNNFNINVQN